MSCDCTSEVKYLVLEHGFLRVRCPDPIKSSFTLDAPNLERGQRLVNGKVNVTKASYSASDLVLTGYEGPKVKPLMKRFYY